ncbi:PC20A [Cryptosporidium bovis]|uniref:PC20A n=1 Tax=Cryptosporidium bovis TaxID=310047 RepID=UPI00351A0DD6|nr:PC20A [Cryptosporidium bovis]
MHIKKLGLYLLLTTFLFAFSFSEKVTENNTLEKEFKEFDLNGDGLIDAQEIRMVKVSVTLQELHQFFWEIDSDSSGTISFVEYSVFVTNNSHYVQNQ